MATGFSRTLEGGHDVIYDYCCTTCEGQNLNAEALYYCKDCSQLFCEPCKKYHDKFTREHRILGRKEVAKWGNVKPVTSSVMCDEHPGKELEMFCEDHDRLCCHTCISVKHRICKKVKPVSEVAKGIQKSSRFKSFVREATKTQSVLKSLFDKQENNIKLLQEAREDIISILKGMRKDLNQIVDMLEEKSTTEMDTLLTMLKEKMTADKNNYLDIYDKIKKILHDIQNFGKQCDALAFQGYKICCEQVAGSKNLLSSLKDAEYKLQFTPDDNIKQFLFSQESLGSFHVTPSGIDDTLQNHEPTKPLISSDHVYSVVNKQTYNIKTTKDTKTCRISGMCLLPNGETAVVDNNNAKVKLLSTSKYCVLDELKLPTDPQDICSTTGTELAAIVCDYGCRHEIQFINAENKKLSHARTVKLDHECYGIANHHSQLYVGSDTALYVYSLPGKKLKKLYVDESGTYLPVYRFSLNDDGYKIHVTNYGKCLLLTLDSLGNQLSTFIDPELQLPTGVCDADNGLMFVCGRDSNTVLQVDTEKQMKMNTVATQADGVNYPCSLCYDKKTQILLIGQGMDNLRALQMK